MKHGKHAFMQLFGDAKSKEEKVKTSRSDYLNQLECVNSKG